MFSLALIGIPIAYLVVLVGLLVRREPGGLGLSLLFFAAAVMTGVWAIDQSRSSTAGIAFLGIPLMGALGGFLGLAFGRWRSSSEPARKIGAWVGLAGALLLVSFNISQGAQTKSKNRTNDNKWAAQSAEIARDRKMIDSALKLNAGRERRYLDSSIRARMNDRAFLIAALPHDSISPALLDTLAASNDLGISLEAVRNPGTDSVTLARVFRTHSVPFYFFQALAAHHHTPPEILRQLYQHPEPMGGLAIWFASNPSTPRDVLDEISKSTDRNVIAQLLENPALDCQMLMRLGVRLTRQSQSDSPDANVMRVTELVPQKCGQKAAQ